MTSYFTKWANATLYLQKLDTGTIIVDPETGNQIPPLEPDLIPLTAIINMPRDKDMNQKVEPNAYLGQDVNEVYVEGWLVNPMQFPVGIKTPIVCNCEIDQFSGILRIPLLIPSSYGYEAKTGARIVGYFQKQN